MLSDEELEQFGKMVELISLITWGLHRDVLFRNGKGEKLRHAVEVLQAIDGSDLYITTDEQKFLQKFQYSYQEIYQKESFS